MTKHHDHTRFYLTLPHDDPRFARMHAVLEAVQIRGRKSPVSRMLAEWALLGFALQYGLLTLPNATTSPAIPMAAPDPNAVVEQQRAIEESMAAFGFE